MVFYMPGSVEPAPAAAQLTPRQIVAELDRFVVGQAAAKRAVAVALRNRARRRRLSPEMAEEVLPKNILMIGPTGVGKTEIARRLARLAGAPFVKVEASKFTEVGYVGRDVESMIRDLVDVGIDLVRQERRGQVAAQALVAVQRRLLDVLLPPRPRPPRPADAATAARDAEEQAGWERSREVLRVRLEQGELEDRVVEVEVAAAPTAGFRIFGQAGMEEMDMNLREMMPGLFQQSKRRRKLTVREARELLQREEEDKLLDPDQIAREAIHRVEQNGILFIDEIDKVAGREGSHGPDVSREGVQRDLLPVVEGTLVHTKHGMVRTDHILFLAAGAFHVSKPSDLIPELQGRFPIRVELASLGRDDLIRILTEPESALTRQYAALLGADDVDLRFTEDGVEALAQLAEEVNRRTEDIGARRLHTILEKVLEDVSFEAPDGVRGQVVVDGDYVRSRVGDLAASADLSRFVL